MYQNFSEEDKNKKRKKIRQIYQNLSEDMLTFFISFVSTGKPFGKKRVNKILISNRKASSCVFNV